MNESIESCIRALQYPNSYLHGRMEVVPLFSPQAPGMEYLTLEEAMAGGDLLVSEISKEGSVPELMVKNKGRIPVLLIDGEEIAGAKQNRVLNTTILVAAESALVIPVSCTEHGRWSYDSPFFTDSRVMMDYKIRQKKMASVSGTLRHQTSRHGDQSEIWEEIGDMSARARVASPTGAMKEVYEANLQKMKQYTEAFPLQPGQQGVLVYMDNLPAGMDFLSRPEVYGRIHDKLIRSYAIEALIDDEMKEASPEKPERPKDFLERVCRCTVEQYPAVGLGTEFRLGGEGLVGSALLSKGAVIHMAFFTEDESRDERASMAGYRTRREYRKAGTHE
jgi:hypothetical protein